jgi:hypothetical protein
MERPAAKTNAENNREYRLRKGDIINAKKRADRLANRAIITPPIEYEAPAVRLKKLAKLPPPKQATQSLPKGEHTKQTYISFIRQFYKRYAEQELSDTADIIKKINEQKYNALNVSNQFKQLIINNYTTGLLDSPYEVNNLYKIFVDIRGFSDIVKQLKPYVLEYAKQYEDKRSVAIVEDKADLNLSFDTETITDNINKIVDKTDKIIYGFIFLLKGRLNDLRLIKITKNKADITNAEYNYIYEDKIYINNTKTGKPYTINMPIEFRRLYDENDEGYLLGGLIAPSTLSQRLQKITKGIYGKVYTYLNIRHIYATQINAKGASLKEREDTSKQAGHSVGQQLKYAYKVA